MTAEVDVARKTNGSSEANEGKPKSLVSVAAMVRADELGIHNALIGGIAADKVAVERGFVRGALALRELQVRQAGAGTIVSGGSTSIKQGGAQTVISAGSVQFQQAGSGITVARKIEVGSGSMVVFGIAPSMEVQEGGRVMFGTRASLALLAVAGAVIGAAVIATRGKSGR
jgi:hypothetical protein